MSDIYKLSQAPDWTCPPYAEKKDLQKCWIKAGMKYDENFEIHQLRAGLLLLMTDINEAHEKWAIGFSKVARWFQCQTHSELKTLAAIEKVVPGRTFHETIFLLAANWTEITVDREERESVEQIASDEKTSQSELTPINTILKPQTSIFGEQQQPVSVTLPKSSDISYKSQISISTSVDTLQQGLFNLINSSVIPSESRVSTSTEQPAAPSKSQPSTSTEQSTAPSKSQPSTSTEQSTAPSKSQPSTSTDEQIPNQNDTNLVFSKFNSEIIIAANQAKEKVKKIQKDLKKKWSDFQDNRIKMYKDNLRKLEDERNVWQEQVDKEGLEFEAKEKKLYEDSMKQIEDERKIWNEQVEKESLEFVEKEKKLHSELWEGGSNVKVNLTAQIDVGNRNLERLDWVIWGATDMESMESSGVEKDT